MKALIVADGLKPDLSLIKGLLPLFDLVVAADGGMNDCMAHGIFPDAVVGDLDSVNPLYLKDLDQSQVICYPHGWKKESDTHKALMWAVSSGASELWLAGASGGRLDHFLAALLLQHTDFSPMFWLTDVFCLQRLEGEVCLNLEQNEIISFFSLFSQDLCVSSKGLRWELNGVDWGRGEYSLSNQAAQIDVFLEIKGGSLLLVRSLDSFLKSLRGLI